MSAPAERLRDLVLAFQRHGITRREDRIRLCIDHAGRHLTSSADMTEAEVDQLLHRLARLQVGNLPAVVTRLHREEEERARRAAERSRQAPQAIVCTRGGGKPTARDLEAVRGFADQLTVLTEGGLLAPPHQWTEDERELLEPPGYSAGVLELGYEGDG